MPVLIVVLLLVNLEPRLFSFNALFGACSECDGLGIKLEVDVDLVCARSQQKRCVKGTAFLGTD